MRTGGRRRAICSCKACHGMLFGLAFYSRRPNRPGSREVETCRRDRRRAFTVSRWTWQRPPGHTHGQVDAAAKQRTVLLQIRRRLFGSYPRQRERRLIFGPGFYAQRTDSPICTGHVKRPHRG